MKGTKDEKEERLIKRKKMSNERMNENLRWSEERGIRMKKREREREWRE